MSLLNPRNLVGLTEEEATQKIEAASYIKRIKRRDKEDFTFSPEINKNRVNLTIEGGKVTWASLG